MVMIQGRRQRSYNPIYIWIFAVLGVLLGVWYIFANNNSGEDISDPGSIDTGSVATGDTDTIKITGEVLKFVPGANLVLDQAADTSISAVVGSDSITFSDTNGTGSATLLYFNCQANDPTRDCDKFLTDSSAIDTFRTTNGLTFVKQSDGAWLGSSDNTMGYKIITDSDQLFYDLSAMLTPIDKSYIESNISDIFQNYCYKGGSRMTTIVSQRTRNVSSIWMSIVDGLDINGDKVTCSISTTIEDNELVVKMTDYKQGSSNDVSTGTATSGTQDNNTINVSDTDTTVDNNTSPTKVGTVPNLSTSGIVFNSTRGGYSVSFPSKNVLYQGTNINTGLGLSDTNCYVNIGVKAYTDKDNTSIGNGVSIYECASKLSPETIKSKLPAGTNVQTSPDGSKVFIIQSNDSTWNEFAQSIEIGALATTPTTGNTITVE